MQTSKGQESGENRQETAICALLSAGAELYFLSPVFPLSLRLDTTANYKEVIGYGTILFS